MLDWNRLKSIRFKNSHIIIFIIFIFILILYLGLDNNIKADSFSINNNNNKNINYENSDINHENNDNLNIKSTDLPKIISVIDKYQDVDDSTSIIDIETSKPLTSTLTPTSVPTTVSPTDVPTSPKLITEDVYGDYISISKDFNLFKSYKTNMISENIKSLPSYSKSFTYSPDEFLILFKLFKSMPKSKFGKKYRASICVVLRNEINLLEFIVRNILSGFGHIYLYDNNDLSKDYDILPILQPFIDYGFITHVISRYDDKDHMNAGVKDNKAIHCANQYKFDSDWMALLDSDEYLYVVSDRPTCIFPTVLSKFEELEIYLKCLYDNNANHITSLLSNVEAENDCSFYMSWRKMYGEGKFLFERDDLLAEKYQRIGISHGLAKLFIRPDKVLYDKSTIPHGPVVCQRDVLNKTGELVIEEKVSEMWPFIYTEKKKKYKNFLMHYFQRTMEEWLIKMNQYIPPYMHNVQKLYSYDYEPDKKATLDHIDISNDYLILVHWCMYYSKLAIYYPLKISKFNFSSNFDFNSGVYHGTIGLNELSRKDFTDFSYDRKKFAIPDYSLYLFILTRVQNKHDFDHNKYVTVNKAMFEYTKSNVKSYVDPLHHFLIFGYDNNFRSCWVKREENKEIKFCIPRED